MTALEAARAALAREHQAVWAYGVITPRAGRREDLGLRSLDAHRALRDDLIDWIRDQKQKAPVAEPGYALPFTLDRPRDSWALARRLEDACAQGYAALAGEAVGDRGLLALAQRGLVEAATRRVAWGGAPDALPGLDG